MKNFFIAMMLAFSLYLYWDMEYSDSLSCLILATALILSEVHVNSMARKRADESLRDLFKSIK